MKKMLLCISRFLLYMLVVFILSGSAPIIPHGIRYFGIKNVKTAPYTTIIAVAEFEYSNLYFSSTDGGYTWKQDYEYEYGKSNIYAFPEEIQIVECVKKCEFPDVINPEIKYRIIPGKSLEMSKDGGLKYQKELEILDWNQAQKNYINHKYSTGTSSNPNDIRGPFYAIYDPTRETILVAMGLEGIMLKAPNEDWKYITVGWYRDFEIPDSSSMLLEIELKTWFSGVYIALLTFLAAFSVKFHRKPNVFSLLLTIVIIVYISLDPLLITLPLYLIGPQDPISPKYDQYWRIIDIIENILPYLMAALLLGICIFWGITTKNQKNKEIIKLIVLSLICSVVFYSFFILWSQGIIATKYNTTSYLGLFSWILILFFSLIVYLVNRYVKKMDKEGPKDLII